MTKKDAGGPRPEPDACVTGYFGWFRQGLPATCRIRGRHRPRGDASTTARAPPAHPGRGRAGALTPIATAGTIRGSAPLATWNRQPSVPAGY